MDFRNVPNDLEDGVSSNECQLVWRLSSDPGFALLTSDQYYIQHHGDTSAEYRLDLVPHTLIVGQDPPREISNLAKR